MDLKKPLTISEQLEQLESHGLVIADRSCAANFLSEVNYYKFTGYALQLRLNEETSDFVPGHTFEEVRSLYLFDSEMRNVLRKYLEIAEIYYKTQIANSFSLEKCTAPPYDQHYDERNYYDVEGFHHILDVFQKEKGYYADSLIVKHHNEFYDGKMPLWVIVELMSFSSVSMLYRAMYTTSKDRIASKLHIGSATLANHLHCLSVLRNKCSHGARLLNTRFHPPAKLSSTFLRRHPTVNNASLFAYLLVLAWRLPSKDDRKSLVLDVCEIISRYEDVLDLSLIGFPTNYASILSWICNSGDKRDAT